MKSLVEFFARFHPWSLVLMAALLVLMMYVITRAANRCRNCGSWFHKTVIQSISNFVLLDPISPAISSNGLKLQLRLTKCMKCGWERPVGVDLFKKD